MKIIISKIHKQAREKGDELEKIGGNRIKFMLETLSNVKNNNMQEMKKNPNFIDQERDENCRKRIKGVIGQVQVEPVPAIGLRIVWLSLIPLAWQIWLQIGFLENLA